MEACRRFLANPEHRPGPAHQVLQQVDGVNGLVDQRPSAVQWPRCPPGSGPEVVGLAKPLHRRLRQQQFPQSPVLDRSPNSLNRRQKSRLKNDSQSDAGLPAGSGQKPALFQAHLNGLLHHDVLAGPGRKHPQLTVSSTGSADTHGIHSGALEKTIQVQVPTDAVALGLTLGARPGPVVEADQPGAGNGLNGLGMHIGDPSAPDDSKPDFRHAVSLLGKVWVSTLAAIRQTIQTNDLARLGRQVGCLQQQRSLHPLFPPERRESDPPGLRH